MPSAVAVGDQLPELQQQHDVHASVRYAGASGDFNPLHYDPDFAKDVSPTGGVIAHGMYTMGLASRLVTEWAGGPENVREVGVRFIKPWPIDTVLTFGATVIALEDGIAKLELSATDEAGEQILSGSAAVALT